MEPRAPQHRTLTRASVQRGWQGDDAYGP